MPWTHAKARELKTIDVEISANFLRLVLHPCHINEANLFNQVRPSSNEAVIVQVGLVAINVSGVSLTQDKSPTITPPTALHIPPALDDFHLKDFKIDIPRFGVLTLHEVAEIVSQQRNYAVDIEDFDLASKLKSYDDELREKGQHLRRLDMEKRRVIQLENFVAAKDLKREIQVILDQLHQLGEKIQTDWVEIPNVAESTTDATGQLGESSPRGTRLHPSPPKERPIRPNRYDFIQKAQMDEQNATRQRNEQSAKFLAGVPNCEFLPSPEEIPSHVLLDYGELTTNFGDYVVQCALSKMPALREAALLKVSLGTSKVLGDDQMIIPQLFVFIEIGLQDTNLQVFQAGCDLLHATIRHFVGIPDSQMHSEVRGLLKLMLTQAIGEAHDRTFAVKTRPCAGTLS